MNRHVKAVRVISNAPWILCGANERTRMRNKTNAAEKNNIINLPDVMAAQAEAERISVGEAKRNIVPEKREKLPLTRDKKVSKPFPVHALMGLQAPTEAATNISQAPVELAVQGTVSAANYSLQGHIDVDVGFGRKPISCNFIISARSGERKSGCETLTWEAIRERQDELIELLGNDPKNRDEDGNLKISPLIIATEPTSEGLIQHLERSIGSVAMATDEGGAWLGGYAMSKEQALKTMSKLSSLWDGKTVSSMRAGSTKSRIAAHKRLSVSIMGQPSVISKLLASPVARDQGFLSRCLITEPESKIGTRSFRKARPEDLAIVRAFNKRLLEILRRPMPKLNGSVNSLDPRVLRPSREARELLAGFADGIEKQCAPGGKLTGITDFVSKAPEHAARLAATLAAWDDFDVTCLKSDYMAAGIEIAEWYIGEALRLSGAELDTDLDLAVALLDWLRERKDVSENFSLVELYQRGPALMRTSKTARRIMKLLIDHGWCEPVDGSVEFDGLPRREVYRLS